MLERGLGLTAELASTTIRLPGSHGGDMKRCLGLGAIPLLLAVTSSPVLAQSTPPKQPAKKPPVKAAPKAAGKPEPAKPAPPPPDLSVTSSYVAGDTTTTGIVVMHGDRQRVSYEAMYASIQ